MKFFADFYDPDTDPMLDVECPQCGSMQADFVKHDIISAYGDTITFGCQICGYRWDIIIPVPELAEPSDTWSALGY